MDKTYFLETLPERIEELEGRIEELEKRVAELEKAVQPEEIALRIKEIATQLPEEERLNKVEVIKVIHVSIARGDGSKNDAVRYVDQYWSLSGKFLAENDPLND